MDVPLIRVDLGPGVLAGFTTRVGGFTLSATVGDAAAARANRHALAAALGAPLAFAEQVHGADVVAVTRAGLPADPLVPVGRGDALVTTENVALGVLVADCVPVLLADPEAGVVAAVHAGRAGVVRGVVGRAVAAMVARGGRPDRVRAAVGPAVCGRCYEVGADLRAEVSALVPAASATTSWGTPALDLPAAVLDQLAAAGVSRVTRTDRCTLEDDALFSHRGVARGRPAGRQAGVVVKSAPAPRVAAGPAGTRRSVGSGSSAPPSA